MIRPLGDRVVVQVTEVSNTTEGGIALLRSADPEAPLNGKIIAVGPGAYNDAGIREVLEVAVGDAVAFSRDTGVQVQTNVVVMHESEIIAVVG